MSANPIMKWAGGKRQLLDKIKLLMPDTYNTYFEAFVGGGAVVFDLLPNNAVINDVNSEIIAIYRCLANDGLFDRFINLCHDHERNHSEEYFYHIRAMDRENGFSDYPLEVRAARALYLNKACFNGLYRVNSKGFFNVPSAKKSKVHLFDEDNISALHDYFSHGNVTILNEDFALSVQNAQQNDFVYFDPPYDTFDGKDNFTSYSKDSFGKNEQIRLANTYRLLNDRGVKVMLSNHNTQFIRDLYNGFNIHVVDAVRRINSDASKRGAVEEVLITNYER